MKNTIKPNTVYKINPEFDEWETDTYMLESAASDGMYFYRFVDGEHQASELAFFNSTEIADGVLAEVEMGHVVNGLSAHMLTYKLGERARKVYSGVQFHRAGSDVIANAQATIRRNGCPEAVVTAAHLMTEAEWQEYQSK